jgi:epoxyqueuosine reductase
LTLKYLKLSHLLTANLFMARLYCQRWDRHVGTCEMIPTLLHQLDDRGWKGRVVPVHHLRDLQEEIEDRHRQGLFDEEFYQECLTGFEFGPPGNLLEPRSLIVVAVPQSQIRFTFTWNGEAVPLVVTGILGAEGYRALQVVLPKKLLAARSGLGAYGRINVCYALVH